MTNNLYLEKMTVTSKHNARFTGSGFATYRDDDHTYLMFFRNQNYHNIDYCSRKRPCYGSSTGIYFFRFTRLKIPLFVQPT